ncbi:MAG TPA: hypothetical protein DIT05_01325 [Morganella sp. (in: Bacteria)]|nr:hypothetical protein [Morganella sp. (in: enterobacteria)]
MLIQRYTSFLTVAVTAISLVIFSAVSKDENDIQFNTDLLDLKDKNNIDFNKFKKPSYIVP